MNKIYSFIAIAAAAAMITGCDNYDDRYTPEYASVVRLEQFGEHELTAWTINDSEIYKLNILRSGHNIGTATTATVRVMSDEEWKAYASTYGLGRYYKIPNDCFKFSESGSDMAVIDFAPNQISGETAVTILSGKLSSYSQTLPGSGDGMEGDGNVICLPIKLESGNGSVLQAQSTLLLKVMSMDATLTLSTTGFEKIKCSPSSSPIVREYTINLSCENPWGFTVKLENNKELLDSYNSANDTRYTLMGASAIEILDNGTWKPWADSEIEFPIGSNTKTVSVRIDPAKVGMMDAMALCVSKPSLNLTTDVQKLSNIVAVQVKPSTQRIRISASDISASTDDGTHTAKNLVDGKRNSYYSSNPEPHDGDPVYGSYVDIKLPSPIRYFAFDYMSRFDFFGDGSGIPNEVDIYVSDDGNAWEKCGSITGMRRNFNNMSQTVTYGNFDAGKEIKYVRWAVIKGGASGLVDHRQPNTTAYWSASVLYIYGK